MAWKPEYAANRKMKAQTDPEYRAKRNAQSTKDKDARKEYMKEYYEQNMQKFRRTPEQQAKYNQKRKEEYAANAELREYVRQKVKEWQENNPQKRKAQRISKYGLTMDQYDQMMQAQNHQCAICGHSDLSNKNYFPVVDHCHTTGKVRGLICMNCNQGLGKFKDNIQSLEKAIVYLKQSQSRS